MPPDAKVTEEDEDYEVLQASPDVQVREWQWGEAVLTHFSYANAPRFLLRSLPQDEAPEEVRMDNNENSAASWTLSERQCTAQPSRDEFRSSHNPYPPTQPPSVVASLPSTRSLQPPAAPQFEVRMDEIRRIAATTVCKADGAFVDTLIHPINPSPGLRRSPLSLSTNTTPLVPPRSLVAAPRRPLDVPSLHAHQRYLQ